MAHDQSNKKSDFYFADAPLSAGLPILLVDDDKDAVYFMHRALRLSGLSSQLFVVTGGLEAIAYLGGEGQYADRHRYPLPSLFLLDLKMPRVDGFDVLAWLLTQPQLDPIAVIILSNSDLESDVEMAREMGADDYCRKPDQVEDLARLLQDLHSRWLADKLPMPRPSLQSSSSSAFF